MPEILPYSRQSLNAADIAAVTRVLKSNFLTTGPEVGRFEKAIAGYCGARFAVACSSGTAGLHLACLAAGLGPQDRVVTSPVTFAATANSARYVGAEVIFSDIDGLTGNLSLPHLTRLVRSQKAAHVRAVIPVHYAGQPMDLAPLRRLFDGKKRVIIEDACHALGAERRDARGRWNRVGSCRYSDMTVFSLHPVKTITGGEGGVVTTQRKDLYERLLRFRNHGVERQRFVNRSLAVTEGMFNPWYYEMVDLGFNYRLSDFQCALAASQLKRIDSFIRRRKRLADTYRTLIRRRPFKALELLAEDADARSSHHLFAVKIDFNFYGISRSSLMKALQKKGVGSQVHYIPLHLQPYYRNRYHLKPEAMPESLKFYEQILSLPLYPQMTPAQVRSIVQALRNVLEPS